MNGPVTSSALVRCWRDRKRLLGLVMGWKAKRSEMGDQWSETGNQEDDMRTNTPNVEMLTREVLVARKTGTLCKDDAKLVRRIYEAVWRDMEEHPEVNYDPECDVRVDWLRQIARSLRENAGKRPVADAVTEELVEWLLHGPEQAAEVCGKDRAAGAAGDQ